MFERFTDRARKVMALANQEAQRLNHEYIGTEHILLGLAKEGAGVGATVLRNLGVSLTDAREMTLQFVKPGVALSPSLVRRVIDRLHGASSSSGRHRLPLTPRAKKVVEHALEEGRVLGHRHVGTEHLLLGLIDEHEGVAAQVLLRLGASAERVRSEVQALLDSGGEAAPDESFPHDFSTFNQLSQAALAEARRSRDSALEAKHVLLAIARDPSSRTGALLRDAGLTPERIEELLRDRE